MTNNHPELKLMFETSISSLIVFYLTKYEVCELRTRQLWYYNECENEETQSAILTTVRLQIM